MRYKDYEFTLKEDDALFLYTDGIPEANNIDKELFGNDRMLDALNIDPDAKPEQILSNMKEEVKKFVGEADQFDDLTMLCLKYHGNQ